MAKHFDRRLAAVATALAGVMLAGCVDNSPPPPRSAVPAQGSASQAYASEALVKPVIPTPPDPAAMQPGYYDQPLLEQAPPEQPPFLAAYGRVGRPRLVVFVDRTLDGQPVPVNGTDAGPLLTIRHSQSATGGLDVERSNSSDYGNIWSGGGASASNKFQTNGPGTYTDSTDIYLRPGQYDEANAKALDYEAIENELTDWLSAGGQVSVVSPALARQRLSDQQVKELQAGRPQALSELAQQLSADVLVQVTIHPTRQSPAGLAVRLIAEAANTKDGISLARATLDISPPLDKPTLNQSTRIVSRILMERMTQTWNAMAAPPASNTPPAPAALPSSAGPSSPTFPMPVAKPADSTSNMPAASGSPTLPMPGANAAASTQPSPPPVVQPPPAPAAQPAPLPPIPRILTTPPSQSPTPATMPDATQSSNDIMP